MNKLTLTFLLAVAGAAIGAACSESGSGPSGDHDGNAGAGRGGEGAGLNIANPENGIIVVDPPDITITITDGKPAAPVTFRVIDEGSRKEYSGVTWRLSRPELGKMDTETGVFTASGKIGASADVIAEIGDKRANGRVTVNLTLVQNGGEDLTEDTGGGRGGVGGPGVGGPVTDDVKAVLDSEPLPDSYTKWLYPYDGTVFPIGILSPLLQWSEGLGALADGIRLKLKSKHIEYTGYFGRPASLAAGDSFIAHPFPKEMWDTATLSAAGEELELELVTAAKGKAYGPMKQTWKIAPGKLKGTVYYQTYGTQGIVNDPSKDLGGAILSISPGDISPKIVAGTNGEGKDCRVCHSVSSKGTRLVVGNGAWKPYMGSSAYKLDEDNEEINYGYGPSARLNLFYAAPYPDGSIVLGSAEDEDWEGLTDIWEIDTETKVTHTGLYDFVEEALLPAFSHDGKQVAFTFKSGPGVASNGQAEMGDLVVMDFDRASMKFSNPRIVYAPEDTSQPGQWASFTPDGKALIFQVLIEKDSYYGNSIASHKGELWWVDINTGEAARLDLANGLREGELYLPVGATYHPNDAEVNFEPTVSPIASGGYAWMVFASRRLYGHVVDDTVEPKVQVVDKPHPRKLWVAAINLDRKPGEDVSHPPFYLPGQELKALNSRGYWVNSPCKENGESCEVGVDWCSGVCLDDGSGKLVCGDKVAECSYEFEPCKTTEDCCIQAPNLECINEICTRNRPK